MASTEAPPTPSGPPAPESPDARPPWRAWTAPAALASAIVLSGIVGVLVVSLFVAIGGSGKSPAATVIATYLQDLCFVFVALFFAQLVRLPHPRQFGLRPTRPVMAALLVVGAYALFLAVSYGWLSALGLRHIRENLPNELGANDGGGHLVAVIVLVAVVAPIAEEVLFRGYMFTALRGWAGPWGAAAIVGVLFGAIHAYSSPAGFLLPLAVFGFLLCLVYWRTRSLYPCLALHALNNAVAFGGTEHWTWQIPVLVVGAWAAIAALVVPVARLGWRYREA